MIDTDHEVIMINRVLWHTDGHTTGILPPAKGSNQNELNVYTTEWANTFYFDYATWRWEYSGLLPQKDVLLQILSFEVEHIFVVRVLRSKYYMFGLPNLNQTVIIMRFVMYNQSFTVNDFWIYRSD